MNVIKEACVESLDQALNAERKGANRLELVTQYNVGGLTPSKELIEEVAEGVSIPIRVMIRPRAGNFFYNKEEHIQILKSINVCKKLPVDGVVFGILKHNNILDIKEISKIAKHAFPLKVVIHKAIDQTPDILIALRQLLEIDEITTILTSGGKANAAEGAVILKEMIAIAGDAVEIMAQGDISPLNFKELHKVIKANAYHGKFIVGEIL